MRVLIAPNAYAGTLSSVQAADAIARGWGRERPDDELVCLPMADGGDGTLQTVEAAVRSRRVAVEVADARGYATTADWLDLGGGRAFVESVQAAGLHRLPADQRNPRLATTYGVGQLIAAALAAGATDITVGVGGTATVDGGAGMATALGHRLLREDGNGVKVGGEYLALLSSISPRGALPAIVTAAVDVDAPLLGPNGAVAGFAAQKGAAAGDLPVLEAALTQLADIAERDVAGGTAPEPRAGAAAAQGPRWRDLPGAGAGGGLGFGLAAFAGAALRPGAQVIAELVGLPAAMAGADIVVTGEGHLDAWSVRGKAPGFVAALAREVGARVLAITGSADAGAAQAFDAVAVLGEEGLQEPERVLVEHAARLAARGTGF